jgi:hypothetical protein
MEGSLGFVMPLIVQLMLLHLGWRLTLRTPKLRCPSPGSEIEELRRVPGSAGQRRAQRNTYRKPFTGLSDRRQAAKEELS